MKSLFIVIQLIFFLYTIGNRQSTNKIDSLRKVAAKSNDPQSYYDLSRLMIEQGKRDSAFIFVQKALVFVKDKKLEMNIRLFYGKLAFAQGFYSMGQDQAFKSLELSLTLKDSIIVSQ